MTDARPMKWTEHGIARAIALQVLSRKCVVLVDNCNWTGHECDVLAVTRDLRIIDIEVKISRADLKADADKGKWWQYLTYDKARDLGMDVTNWSENERKVRTDWPRKVWKHYYALPRNIWMPELSECLPSKASGVLLLSEQKNSQTPIVVHCERRATPNKSAMPITAAAAIDIARLANLRMWEAYRRRDQAVEDMRRRAETAGVLT